MVELERIAFGKAVAKGVLISFGTDAGGFAWTENQAKEFAYMVRYGMTPMQAIQSATTVAAGMIGWQGRVGRLAPGAYAFWKGVGRLKLHDIDLKEQVLDISCGESQRKSLPSSLCTSSREDVPK